MVDVKWRRTYLVSLLISSVGEPRLDESSRLSARQLLHGYLEIIIIGVIYQ
jgi:hypothetical protein